MKGLIKIVFFTIVFFNWNNIYSQSCNSTFNINNSYILGYGSQYPNGSSNRAYFSNLTDIENNYNTKLISAAYGSSPHQSKSNGVLIELKNVTSVSGMGPQVNYRVELYLISGGTLQLSTSSNSVKFAYAWQTEKWYAWIPTSSSSYGYMKYYLYEDYSNVFIDSKCVFKTADASKKLEIGEFRYGNDETEFYLEVKEGLYGVLSESVDVSFNWYPINGYGGMARKVKYRVKSKDGQTYPYGTSWSSDIYVYAQPTPNITFTEKGDYELEFFMEDVMGQTYGPYTKSLTIYSACKKSSFLQGLNFFVERSEEDNYHGVTENTDGVLNNYYELEGSTDQMVEVSSNKYYDLYYGGSEENNLILDKYYTIDFSELGEEITYIPKVPSPGSSYDFPPHYIEGVGAQYGYFSIQEMGAYEISPTVKNENSGCPLLETKLWLTVDGKNQSVVEANCAVNLPEDLYNKFTLPDPEEPAGKYMLEHFRYKITSSKGIVVKDGMKLESGAVLEINPIDSYTLESDRDKNWNHTIVYDESNQIIGESRNYIDVLGRVTQSQVKDLEHNIVLATETIYDKENRPTLQTLPAPLTTTYTETTELCSEEYKLWGSDLLFLKSNGFVKNTSGQKYSYNDFEGATTSDSKLEDVEPLQNNTPGTLGWYYSANNNEQSTSAFSEPNTATTEYPFVQMYYNNTDQMYKTVGPGDVYRENGIQHVGRSEILSLTTTDQALIDHYYQVWEFVTGTQLSFGFDPAEKVYKQEFIDANDRLSVSYMNTNGQNIILADKETDAYTYKFFDIKGRLMAALTPNAVDKLIAGGDYNNFPLSTQLKPSGTPKNSNDFYITDLDATFYKYNFRGDLTESNEKDAGKTEYLYRKDGRLKFIQNSKQAEGVYGLSDNLFSYINYDRLGRVIQEGEYQGSTTFEQAKSLVETNNISGGNDVVVTSYDYPDLSFSAFEQKNLEGSVSYTSGSGSKTWYSYDERGRVIAAAQKVNGFTSVSGETANPVFVTEYKYNYSGDVYLISFYKTDVNGSSIEDEFYHFYEYDKNSNLKRVYVSSTNAPVLDEADSKKLKAPYGNPLVDPNDHLELQATYYYYKHGPLKRVELGENMQSLDYAYTIEGWLKSINNPNEIDQLQWETQYANGFNENEFVDDVFGQILTYYEGDYTKNTALETHKNAPDLYNGAITSVTWEGIYHQGDPNTYENPSWDYYYDGKYQLLMASFNTYNNGTNTLTEHQAYNVLLDGYDKNGNISGINRRDEQGALMHDFGYVYEENTNRLTRTSNNSRVNLYNEIGELMESTEIANYNDFPNMYIENQWMYNYNSQGLMTSVNRSRHNNGSISQHYAYDEYGSRLAVKQTETATPQQSSWYVNDPLTGNNMAVYYSPNTGTTAPQLQEYMVYGSNRIGAYDMVYKNSITDPDFEPNTYTQFELKDHLGSVRAIVQEERIDPDGDGNTAFNFRILSYADYYPYGLKMQGRESYIVEPYRYAYQGEYATDEVPEVGLTLFDARSYDPVLGRWLSVDPARQFASPYTGMGNSPGMYIDKDGRWVHIAIGAVIGGAVNLAMNWDNIDNFGEGAVSFLVGAGAGAAMAACGTCGAGILIAAGGGAAVSATNSVIAQTNNEQGLSDVQWGQVGQAGVVGLFSGAAGYGAGMYATNYLASPLINAYQISSPALAGFVNGTIGGAAGGFGGGFVGGYMMGGTLDAAWQGGWQGLYTGTFIGGATGFSIGYSQQLSQKNSISPKQWERYEFADSDGDWIRVRHHTSRSSLKGIKYSKQINASRGVPYGVDVELYPFLKPADVNLGQFGRGAYVEFSIPRSQISSLPSGYLGGAGNGGRIVTGGKPLNLPVETRYVRWKWY